MKRVIAQLLAVLVLGSLAFAVVGCSGAKTDEPPATGTDKPAEGGEKPAEGTTGG